MARLAAKEKLLYYPTPELVTAIIATHFNAAGQVRMVDPCCGDGAALRDFADSLDGGGEVETWGIELSQIRAADAEAVLDRVLPTNFYTATWDRHSSGLIFNNPPYDWSSRLDQNGKKIRHEHLFVTESTPRLVTGGHQVIIIPRTMLTYEPLARHLMGWYEDIHLFRFPDGEYERFKQVVLFALTKRKKYQVPTKDRVASLVDIGNTTEEECCLKVLPVGTGKYKIPPSLVSARFSYTPITAEDMVLLAEKASGIGFPQWLYATRLRGLGEPIAPLVPLKLGHLTMTISSGDMGTVRVDRKDGQTMLVKGVNRKGIKSSSAASVTDDGDTVYHHEEQEVFETHITALKDNGDILTLSKPQTVASFITEHAEHLGNAIMERNHPEYNFDPTDEEWSKISRVALGLPPLPGRDERGLFKVQKHFAIAAVRGMRKRKHIILNAEMGFGKSPCTVGAMSLLDEWPVLIMAPGHMMSKWRRTIELSADPDDPITARVITYPVRADHTWWETKLVPTIEDAGGEIEYVERFQVSPTSRTDNGLRRRFFVEVGSTDRAKVIKEITNKTGRGSVKPQIKFAPKGFEVTIHDKDEYTLGDFFREYDSGLLGEKAVAIASFEKAKLGPGAEVTVRRQFKPQYVPEASRYLSRSVVVCPSCGGRYPATDELPMFCSRRVDEKGKPIPEDGEEVPGTSECKAPLFQMTRWRRDGLARIIQKQYRYRFGLFVFDEMHKAKAGRTDIGIADHRLVSSCRYSIGLTGTLFGGTAGSLFYMLYRRNKEVRDYYDYRTGYTSWVDHYGLWERSWTEKEPHTVGRGVTTNIERWNFKQKELPGVSPAIIRYLLPITLFGEIVDLGYTLPPLRESVIELDMPNALADQYTELDQTLLSQAMELMEAENDPGGLATWFSRCRYRPSAAFRPEEVNYKDAITMDLPSVVTRDDPYLPKEEWLAQLVEQDRRAGRKTLVFVEQSGTRDIRPRLIDVLQARVPGVKAEMLSAGDMSPAAREAWIENNAPKIDVLLVNPSLVETGLDLVMFSHIIFFETSISLYTLWQAMRRVWRLGQQHPVDVTFFAYRETIEMAILKRMGEKQKYAQLLYGSSAEGALVENEGSMDIQREMIREALSGHTFTRVGEAINDEMVEPVKVFGFSSEVTPLPQPVIETVEQEEELVLAELLEDVEEVVQLAMF